MAQQQPKTDTISFSPKSLWDDQAGAAGQDKEGTFDPVGMFTKGQAASSA